MADLLIFGYGNPSRGDDALGPLLLDLLDQGLSPDTRRDAGGIEFLTDFQLQVDHALDLQNRKLVLFADAHAACPPPFRFKRAEPVAVSSYTSHALSPAAVLGVYRRINRAAPPPSFVLGIRGEVFELGADLSAAARVNLRAALRLALDLCAHPSEAYWQMRAVAR
jgi:hydrogenase maturation protease